MIHPEVIDSIQSEVRKSIAAVVGREVIAPLTGRMARLEAAAQATSEEIARTVEAAVAPLADRVAQLEKALEAYRTVSGAEAPAEDGGKKKSGK